MRLWSEQLLPILPQQQLCGQWRECNALLGNGWGKKHSTVNYVFTHSDSMLVAYSIKVFREMKRRNYNPNPKLIREKLNKRFDLEQVSAIIKTGLEIADKKKIIYPEHNEEYITECLENLKEKGVYLTFEKK